MVSYPPPCQLTCYTLGAREEETMENRYLTTREGGIVLNIGKVSLAATRHNIANLFKGEDVDPGRSWGGGLKEAVVRGVKNRQRRWGAYCLQQTYFSEYSYWIINE